MSEISVYDELDRVLESSMVFSSEQRKLIADGLYKRLLDDGADPTKLLAFKSEIVTLADKVTLKVTSTGIEVKCAGEETTLAQLRRGTKWFRGIDDLSVVILSLAS